MEHTSIGEKYNVTITVGIKLPDSLLVQFSALFYTSLSTSGMMICQQNGILPRLRTLDLPLCHLPNDVLI